MRIRIDVEIPDGQYCNKQHESGCVYLVEAAELGNYYCALFKKYLDKVSDKYCTGDSNIKCNQCLFASSEENINLEGFM